jgi:hypothetical protein
LQDDYEQIEKSGYGQVEMERVAYRRDQSYAKPTQGNLPGGIPYFIPVHHLSDKGTRWRMKKS